MESNTRIIYAEIRINWEDYDDVMDELVLEDAIESVKDGVDIYVVPNYFTLIAERDALQRFKDYTHSRLDGMGIEQNPEGEHSKAGCRIGDRMDIVETLIAEHKLMKEALGMIANGKHDYPIVVAKKTLKQLSDGK